MKLGGRERAVTPVIGVILTVAIVVVLAAVVGTSVLAYSGYLEDPAPRIGESTAKLVPNVAGGDDQIVQMTHVAGDEVEVTDLDVVVDATEACGETVRLLDPTTTNVDPDDIEGTNILSDYELAGVFGTGSNEVWSPGTNAELRLASSECDISSGETVVVRVVHTPSKTVIIDETLTAQ